MVTCLKSKSQCFIHKNFKSILHNLSLDFGDEILKISFIFLGIEMKCFRNQINNLVLSFQHPKIALWHNL